MRKTYARLNEMLDATTVTRTTYQGVVTEEHVDRDNRAVLKAIELFVDTFGITASPKNTPQSEGPTITVVMGDWFSDTPEARNVTPEGTDGR